MTIKTCPGCRQNSDRDSGFCALCGYDFACDLDEAYNHSVKIWLHLTAVLSAVTVLVCVRATGARQTEPSSSAAGDKSRDASGCGAEGEED